jgi:hypothetical protein
VIPLILFFALFLLVSSQEVFCGSIVGSWGRGYYPNGSQNEGEEEYITGTFYPNGYYIHYETGQASEPCDFGGGVEYGTYSYDEGTKALTVQPIVDENGCVGLADDYEPGQWRVEVEGDLITLQEEGEPEFTRARVVEDDASPIVGGWGKGYDPQATSEYTSLTFYSNGYYIHYQTDKVGEDCDNGGGVEYGTYIYIQAANIVIFTPIVDENGCIGPSEDGGTRLGRVEIDGDILTFYEEGEVDVVLERVMDPNALPTIGACMLPADSCMETTEQDCTDAGGSYQGDGTECLYCFSNSDCGSESYCAKPEGDCYGEGFCTQKPGPCPLFYDPVCGCDGETYSNDCFAAQAGVPVYHKGACNLGTLCSFLGDDPRPYAPDMDVFRFSGTEGEMVTVTLESKPPGSGEGQRAVLIIRSLGRGLQLFKRLIEKLPFDMTVYLPVSGDYHVKVMEATGRDVIWGQKYQGDYCVMLEAPPETLETFAPDLDVE